MLGLHFGAMGRAVYLAEEMAVLYPGKEVFTPDVLAVVGVPQPEDDERMAWVVADEGRGLDLVLEVLHRGDRKKDLVDNVERYADLGIPEYFVYDRAQQRIRGHRLPAPGAKRYVPILPQGGLYSSTVLGIELAVEGGTLRFFYNLSELIGSGDLIRRLTAMVDDQGAKADQAAAEAEAKLAQAEARADKATQAMAALRAGILAALDARGLAATGALRESVLSCDAPETLQRWLLRALSASRAEDIHAAEPPSLPASLLAGGVALICGALAAGARAEPSPVRFGWVRGRGADTCPSRREIADQIAERLGRSPFTEGAARSIDAVVTRSEAGWRAEIYVREQDGAPAGARELTSEAPDCGPLASACVLAIALAIDPEAVTRPPPPPVPRGPSAPPPPPAIVEVLPAPLPAPLPAIPAGETPAIANSDGRVGDRAARRRRARAPARTGRGVLARGARGGRAIAQITARRCGCPRCARATATSPSGSRPSRSARAWTSPAARGSISPRAARSGEARCTRSSTT